MLSALDKSKNKTIQEVCDIADVSRGTFYYQFNRDPEFRREVLIQQREVLTQQLSGIRV